ncbi:hypothetical protein EUGRSUZ_C03833 [Eucalyptus grandis]|uniref:Uncharacterized protein n=2 Tax=Eucalyptus grandis TaxID=71139 RepID=A0ACC3LK53_EUCGR|nr:hypothetical protein EUGRSUZ_C03833 [Eucalyptus grandis]
MANQRQRIWLFFQDYVAWQRRWLSSSDPLRILFGLKNERKKGAAGPWPVTLLVHSLDAASVETRSFMSGYE